MLIRQTLRRLRAWCASSLIEEARQEGREHGARHALAEVHDLTGQALYEWDATGAMEAGDLIPDLDASIEEALERFTSPEVEPVLIDAPSILEEALKEASWDAFGVCSAAVEEEIESMISGDGELGQAVACVAQQEAEGECDRWAEDYARGVLDEIRRRLGRVLGRDIRAALDESIAGDALSTSAMHQVRKVLSDEHAGIMARSVQS